MKIKLYLLFLFLYTSTQSFAQTATSVDRQKNILTLETNVLPPTLSSLLFERRLSSLFSLQSGISIGSVRTENGNPSTDTLVTFRRYYDKLFIGVPLHLLFHIYEPDTKATDFALFLGGHYVLTPSEFFLTDYRNPAYVVLQTGLHFRYYLSPSMLLQLRAAGLGNYGRDDRYSIVPWLTLGAGYSW